MDFISSKNIFLLTRDTLKLMDKQMMKHGSRTGYILYKMLQQKGGYDKFEIAELVMLATLHDIGAYKTDDFKDNMRFEAKNYMAHSVYGYLFMKYLSPMSEKAKILLWHHVDYIQIRDLNYEYKEEAAMLNLAEKIDIYKQALGDKFELSTFHHYADTRYSREALVLFGQANRDHDIFQKIESGEYEKELDELMDYIMFTNEEKKRYMEMQMYALGLRTSIKVMDSVTSICVCEELAKRLNLSEKEIEKLYYGALIHDIGMLAIPDEILLAARKLTTAEIKAMRQHVAISEEILKDRLDQEVLDIVLTHHERLDGSGYPKGLREADMNLAQKILQVADTVTALTNKRHYKEVADKEEVKNILRQEADAHHLSKQVVDTLIENYDDIKEKVNQQEDEILRLYKKLETQYKLVYEKFIRR